MCVCGGGGCVCMWEGGCVCVGGGCVGVVVVGEGGLCVCVGGGEGVEGWGVDGRVKLQILVYIFSSRRKAPESGARRVCVLGGGGGGGG